MSKHTPGPWEIAVYSTARVNDGSHKQWVPPSSIALNECAMCKNPNATLTRQYSDEDGIWHTHRFASDDWHSIYATNGTKITGNYDYEEGGVCSSEADARLIAAAPELLASAQTSLPLLEEELGTRESSFGTNEPEWALYVQPLRDAIAGLHAVIAKATGGAA